MIHNYIYVYNDKNINNKSYDNNKPIIPMNTHVIDNPCNTCKRTNIPCISFYKFYSIKN